jgi:hypothetical protein
MWAWHTKCLKTRAMMIRPLRSLALALLLGIATTSVACAPQDEASSEGASEAEVKTQLSDNALEGKLKGILDGVTFTSESDYPYIVMEGDVVTEKRLSTKLVREKLAAAVKTNSSSHRDIKLASSRSSRLDVSKTIADGDAAEVPADKDSDDYLYAHHDKQLGIALKVMRSQLKSVVGFTFGTNESGDEDEIGPVVYVYVGISKSTGKLVAIMTEAVYT